VALLKRELCRQVKGPEVIRWRSSARVTVVSGISTSVCLQIDMGFIDSSEGFPALRTLSTKLAEYCKFTCANVGHAKR